ncbi:MAG: uncharacterized protein QOD09_2994 [Bradyrhizobium sp.]|jgi:predicted RNA-binding protein YlxR (DUF448 family)|nr:uncharacterized protein [Bradyrhizobium sp.]MEA2953106.1 uncharacterized protein [Alphaproteobacteria bacterium]
MFAHAQDQDSELDTGPRSSGAGTERLCVSTRKVKPVSDMVRFVVGPEGEAVPDLKGKLPGRGVWVTATRTALAEAVRRNAFGRGFGRPVKSPANLVEATERLLERAALDALAVAGKAGQVVTGFGKVEAALARDNVVAVLHASDAAADGVRKISGAVRRRTAADRREVGIIATFASAQLDLALGRPNVVHAALLAGPATKTVLARCSRLDRFRAGEPGEQNDRNGLQADARGLGLND